MTVFSDADFSHHTNVFHERRLPEPGIPVGQAALIDRFGLAVPLPETLTAIGSHHRIVCRDGWRIVTPRHRPEASLQGHLTFAFKHERLDLAVLKRLFLALGTEAAESIVRANPTGVHARRTWFLYEWLTGRSLDVPDSLGRMKYVAVMDRNKYLTGQGTRSARHRVINNLPGTPDFCPVVARTPLLDQYVGLDLADAAARVVAAIPSDLLYRAARFLQLEDSKASYSIEGEASAAEPHPAMGSCHWRGRQAPARHGGTVPSPRDPDRRQALHYDGLAPGRRLHRRARPTDTRAVASPRQREARGSRVAHPWHDRLRAGLRPTLRSGHRRCSLGFRVRLRPSVRRWQRTNSQIPVASCPGPRTILPSWSDLPGFGSDPCGH